MTQQCLSNFFSNSISIRLLMSDNKDFILSFLFKTYGDSMEKSIREDKMIEFLKEYIESFGELDSTYYKSKRVEDWLNEWTDIRKEGIEIGGYLEKNRDTYNYGWTYSLSPQTVLVLRWIKELLDYEDGKHIATDSRFSDIFSKLNEMVRQSIADKDEKRQQLIEQKNKIEKEIHDIDMGHYDFERLGTDAFADRFDEVTQMGKNLISDFRQVERNIKDVLKKLYEQKLDAETTSGKLINFVLEADNTWKTTPQGRSFSAFYHFLRASDKREEFKKLIRQVYERLEYDNPDLFLDELVGRLNEQAYEVQKRISTVMKELEQSLTERNNTEEKYLSQLITEIKKLAISKIENPPKGKDFWIVEGLPQNTLPLERPITLEETETKLAKKYVFNHIENSSNPDIIKAEFHGMNPLEKEKIQELIKEILEKEHHILLSDILRKHPVTNGLSELLAYIEIATENKNHIIISEENETILVTKLPNLNITVLAPKIIYCR